VYFTDINEGFILERNETNVRLSYGLFSSKLAIVKERRTEPRVDIAAPAVMTPLAAVATRLNGQVLNVSFNGVKVRVPKLTNGQPRVGDVYRILSSKDLMLCEVRHCQLQAEGTDIGFRILQWSDAGELKRVTTSP
jgi:hypothetical protein